jgi:hypothetical protein
MSALYILTFTWLKQAIYQQKNKNYLQANIFKTKIYTLILNKKSTNFFYIIYFSAENFFKLNKYGKNMESINVHHKIE